MARTPTRRPNAPETAKRPPPRSASRRKRERRRQEALRALSGPRRRSRRLWIGSGAGTAAVILAVVLAVVLTRGSPHSPAHTPTPAPAPTPLGPLLASASTAAGGQPVGDIQCQAGEQVVYHIHAHLAIFVNGAQRYIPEGVGIAPPRSEVQTAEGPYVESGRCFYWLHTHTSDGIIHIESPTARTYTLGQFFAIWNQPLSTTQVGSATGTLFVYVNGKAFKGDPSTITLTAHELIQIDVGIDVKPQPFTFPTGL